MKFRSLLLILIVQIIGFVAHADGSAKTADDYIGTYRQANFFRCGDRNSVSCNNLYFFGHHITAETVLSFKKNPAGYLQMSMTTPSQKPLNMDLTNDVIISWKGFVDKKMISRLSQDNASPNTLEYSVFSIYVSEYVKPTYGGAFWFEKNLNSDTVALTISTFFTTGRFDVEWVKKD